MRLIPPVWCFVLVFSLVLALVPGLSHAQDPGTLLYDIDWDGPPHQVDQRITAGTTSKSPSQIYSGVMYVRSSIGALTNRPLEMSQIEAMYDQFQLGVRNRATRYVLDFDMIHTGSSNLALFLDPTNTGIFRTDFGGDGSITFLNATRENGVYKVTPSMQTPSTYDARSVSHVQMDFDKGNARVILKVNGVTKAQWQITDLSNDFDIGGVRFSSTGAEAIGVDNIQLRAFNALTATYTIPESLNLGTTTVGVPSSVQSIHLENPTREPITLTAVEVSSPVFRILSAPTLPHTIPAKSRVTLSLYSIPTVLGDTFGTFTLRTSAGDLPVPIRVAGTEPLIITQPTSKFLRKGEWLNLTARFDSSNITSYEWTRDSALVQQRPSTTLIVPTVTRADTGIYRLTAVMSSGVRVNANPAYVAVAETENLTHRSTLGSPLTLTCLASAPSPVTLKYHWTHNDIAVTSLTPGVVLAGDRLIISRLDASHIGTYACRVTMEGLGDGVIYHPSGRTEPILVATVALQDLITITTTQLPTMLVGEQISATVTATGPVTRFSATGLPPGLVMDEQTGQITGTALVAQPNFNTPYQVVLRAWSANSEPPVTKTLTWSVLPPISGGTYAGDIRRDYLPDPDGQGGIFRLTVTAKGKVSGRLTVGRQVVSGTGQIQGVTQSGAYTAELNLKAPFGPVHFWLLPNGLGATEPLPIHNDQTGWRVATAAEVQPFIGHFPTGLEAPPPSGPGGGVGFMHLRISRTGNVTWSGVMPNGMTLTGSHPLLQRKADEVHVPLFWLPKALKSSALGWLIWKGEEVNGTLDWGYTQTAGASADGFERCDLFALGTRYTPPAKGIIMLGLDRSPQTVTVAPDGPLAELFQGRVQVQAGHRVVIADPMPFPIEGFTMKINPATASFSGSYIASRLAGYPIRSTFQGLFEASTGEGLGVITGIRLPTPGTPAKTLTVKSRIGSIRVAPSSPR